MVKESAMASGADELLSGYSMVVRSPVDWGDMDAFNHVNNTIYFRFFENARIALLERIGLAAMDSHGSVGPILHSTSARFRHPMMYPDTALIGCRITDVGEDRFNMEHRIVSERHRVVTADGTSVMVCYDYAAGRKAPLPEAVRAEIIGLGASPREAR
jgi:acyl-CoA thioester hydrolase